MRAQDDWREDGCQLRGVIALSLFKCSRSAIDRVTQLAISRVQLAIVGSHHAAEIRDLSINFCDVERSGKVIALPPTPLPLEEHLSFRR